MYGESGDFGTKLSGNVQPKRVNLKMYMEVGISAPNKAGSENI